MHKKSLFVFLARLNTLWVLVGVSAVFFFAFFPHPAVATHTVSTIAPLNATVDVPTKFFAVVSSGVNDVRMCTFHWDGIDRGEMIKENDSLKRTFSVVPCPAGQTCPASFTFTPSSAGLFDAFARCTSGGVAQDGTPVSVNVAPAPGSWLVSLFASETNVSLGANVTLTANANQTVSGTPNVITILEGATRIATCGSGTTCTTTVTSSAGTATRTFVARVENISGGVVEATSSSVPVTWGGGGVPTVNLFIDGSAAPPPAASGLSHTISWTTTNMPVGSTCLASGSWGGNKSTPSGSETLSILTGPMTFVANLQCTNGLGSDTASVSLTVNAPGAGAFNFTLANGGNRAAAQGTSVTNIIDVGLSSGVPAPVSFAASGFPAGVGALFSRSNCTPTCSTNLTLTIPLATPTGSTPITVTGTAGALSRTTTFTLTVTSTGSFTIAPITLNCGTTPVGTPIACNFQAVNNSGSTVTINGVTSSNPTQFTPVVGVPMSVSDGATANLPITFNATTAGTHNFDITFTTTTGSIMRAITGTASGPPGVPGGPPVGGGPGVKVSFKNPLGEGTEFTDLINNIINFIFTIAVIVAPILLVIAGVIFMTAAGDPGKIKTARSMMMWTIVGFGIILISKGLVSVLKGILGI